MSLVPTSLALFSRLLKDIDVDVELFDTSFYDTGVDSDLIEEQNLTVKSAPRVIKLKDTNPRDDLDATIERFSPDLIATTATESTFLETAELLKGIKIPTVLGGVFATFSPEIAIKNFIVCRGEGERYLVELVKMMRDGRNGQVQIDPCPVNLDTLPLIDMSIFDDSRFYRMMNGKLYKMFPVETHRGCPYSCRFCNSPAQNRLYHGRFFRHKAIPKVMEEIEYFKSLGAEYLFMWADNFFAYPKRMIDEFCERYKDIRIPFYCQSHPESLTVEKIASLKAVGMNRIGIGIEHGNEKFRREVVGRNYSNEMLIKKLKILTDLGVEYSTNNIIGFPDETPELVMDTVELNRKHTASDISCSIFTPFRGTALRDVAVKKGYITDDVVAHSNQESSMLDMPQFPPERISGKQRTFNMYVKFPKSRWGEIKLAEEMTPKGDEKWNQLRKEYLA